MKLFFEKKCKNVWCETKCVHFLQNFHFFPKALKSFTSPSKFQLPRFCLSIIWRSLSKSTMFVIEQIYIGHFQQAHAIWSCSLFRVVLNHLLNLGSSEPEERPVKLPPIPNTGRVVDHFNNFTNPELGNERSYSKHITLLKKHVRSRYGESFPYCGISLLPHNVCLLEFYEIISTLCVSRVSFFWFAKIHEEEFFLNVKFHSGLSMAGFAPHVGRCKRFSCSRRIAASNFV